MTSPILDPNGEAITRDSLWATLAGLLRAALVLFGGPLELAEKAWLRIAEHRRCKDWLYRCEELLRRLLYIDARALELAPSAPGAAKHAVTAKPEPYLFDTERPETWRCSFQLNANAASPPRRQARARKPKIDWNTTACAYPLARRLEALLRAFNAPERHVARMARLLRKLPLLGKLFAKPTRTYQTEKTTSGDFSVADAASYIRETDSS